MIAGVVIRIGGGGGGGGLLGNSPGTLAACLGTAEGTDPLEAVFVFENGEACAFTWAQFHAAGAVVGFTDTLCGVLPAELVLGLSAERRKNILVTAFAHAAWPISPRESGF
jgi:hypothetical protein